VARSGARIFSAGSLEFVNGIDDIAARMSGTASHVDQRVQRFVLNMLRGMSGQR
jgi:ATP-dependent 26S proteasome regulatory subunit